VAAHIAQNVRRDRAFERIYRNHAGSVYRYSLAVLREPDEAEQVTRTTFLSAYGALDRGVAPTSADTWLLGIAHALCRKHRGHDESVADELAREDDVLEPSPCPDAERAISLELDGLLTRGERHALHEHLRGCSACRSITLRQRALQAAIRALRAVPLPPSLTQVSSLHGVF
jgi:DNA-directed RNA polymerase specialized sigma24 family protein